MHQQSRVSMSMRKLDRLKCVQAVIEGALRAGLAAERLSLSPRQVRRLVQRYQDEGPMGLISRRYRRPSNNRLESTLETQVVQILRERYADFGPTLAAEKLAEQHQIV